MYKIGWMLCSPGCTPTIVIRWVWFSQSGEDFFVVHESQVSILSVAASLAFERTVDGLESRAESLRAGVHISVPVPGTLRNGFE